MRHIALLGRARSGKDAFAKALSTQHMYSRVAFADQLRVVLEEMNPLVPVGDFELHRLSTILSGRGWDVAKSEVPAVRALLQEYGSAIRHADRMFFVRKVLDSVTVANHWGIPLVVTDVRYPNEAEALLKKGFLLTRVVRPSLPERDPGEHDSETALDRLAVEATILNNGSLADLAVRAQLLVDGL